MNVEQRIAIEKMIVRKLWEEALRKGWQVIYVDDGGDFDEHVKVANVDELIDAVFAVDTSVIYFRKDLGFNKGMTHWCQIVLGNDGWDCIADYSFGERAGDDFRSVMEGHVEPFCAKLEEEHC